MQASYSAKFVFGGTSRPQERATRERVGARTRELAALAGRVPPQISQIDYEQAKRELTGESDTDRQNAVLDWEDATELPRHPSR